jgi:hypothetical protein
MALVLLDRAQETATANTTVSFTLTGAFTGYQTLAGVGNGNTTYYGATDGTNWETGIGTYSTTGPTLTRTTILASSNSNAAVTFTGTVTVWVDYPASKSVGSQTGYFDSNYAGTFVNGIVVDYDAGSSLGRISVGAGDAIGFYNGGVAGTLLGTASSNGDWSLTRFLDVGNGSLVGGATNPIIAAAGSSTGYVQIYIHNDNNGTSASSDVAAYPDNGTDASGWIDMGITSSTYSDATFPIYGANEGYIIMSAPSGSSTTGNLVYATDSTGTQNYHQWYVSGFTVAKSAWKMQLKSTALDLSIPLNSTVATGTAPFTVASTTQVANLNAATAGTATSATTATTATNLAGGAIGSVPYQSAAATTLFLAGTTSATPSFVTSTGTGTVAQAPTLTSSTGSGNVVLATSPTLVTPALGTPSALVGTNITGTATAFNINGTVGATTPTTGAFTRTAVAATAAPTVDITTISNVGFPNVTAGVSALQVNYIGGAAAVEASATRIDLTPGTTTGGTWNGYRTVVTTDATTGVTLNGTKFDNIGTPGAGTSNAIYCGTGWDSILSYNGTSIISGTGTINNASIGATAASTGIFTQLTVNGSNLNTSISPTGTSTVTISPAGALTINPTTASTINNASIGVTTAAAGRFSTATITAGTAGAGGAPIYLTSGTNLTAAVQGAVEFDGVGKYFTPFGTSRGSVPTYQIQVLTSTYTLTSQTAAQKLLNVTTNGAVAVVVGLYEFECQFMLTGMSATSGTLGFALAGTATYTQQWMAHASRSGSAATTIVTGNANAAYQTNNTAANTAITGSSTNTTGSALIKGFIRVTVAGTVIPQVSMSVAAGAIVQTGAYFKITPISATSTATTVGNWT